MRCSSTERQGRLRDPDQATPREPHAEERSPPLVDELGGGLRIVELEQRGDVAGDVPGILERRGELAVSLGGRRERRQAVDRLAGPVQRVLEDGQDVERVLVQLVRLGSDPLEARERAGQVAPQSVERGRVLLAGDPGVRHGHFR